MEVLKKEEIIEIIKKSNTKVIAFNGQMGNGKTTLSEALKPKIKGGVEIVAFADSLKEMTRTLFKEATGNEDPEKKDILIDTNDYRKLLQTFGECARREINEDIWIRILFTKIKKDIDTLIISDLRHNNEAQYIKDMGGIIVNIERPEAPEVTTNHISEQGIDEKYIDYKIKNDEEIDKVIENILKTIKDYLM